MDGGLETEMDGSNTRNMDEKGRVSEAYLTPDLEAGSRLKSQALISNLDEKKGVFRGKTSLRLKYEAEVVFIRKKFGTLENIRNLLGLSQRKMCQLLLVDPSAWNRWTKNGESAPPHIYRALEWYLHLQEKNPSLDQRFWLSQIAQPVNPSADPKFAETLDEIQKLKAEINLLKSDRSNALLRPSSVLQENPHASLNIATPTARFWLILGVANLAGWLGGWLLLR